MADGIYQHVDVREEGKENAFSLGHTLWINTEVSYFASRFTFVNILWLPRLLKTTCCAALQEFEDLDEITARYIQPMASFARDLLGHKYFQDCNGGNKEVYINFFFLLSLDCHLFAVLCLLMRFVLFCL